MSLVAVIGVASARRQCILRRLSLNKEPIHATTDVFDASGLSSGGGGVEGRFSDVKAQKDGKWVYIIDRASVPLPPPPGAGEGK